MIPEVQIFKALSDETRLRILLLLLEGELCVCDLENILETTQSKISRHLSYLKNSGLVLDRRSNVWVYYSLNDQESLLHQELIALLKKVFHDHPSYKEDLNKKMQWLQQKGSSC